MNTNFQIAGAYDQTNFMLSCISGATGIDGHLLMETEGFVPEAERLLKNIGIEYQQEIVEMLIAWCEDNF